jgi:hypothetical protein
MAHTFTQCHYHLVFSTKQRAKLIGTDICSSPGRGGML